MNFKNLRSKKRKFNLKIILLVLIFIIVSISLPLKFAFAGWYDAFIKGFLFFLFVLILGVISLFGFMVGKLAGIITSLLTETLRWAAVARIGDLSFTNRAENEFIDAGLKVTMPLANMAFVLIFVGIAIATILGIENYAIKKMLPLLIIMVLLVNFAPVLVGLLVDAGNVITFYFVKGIDFTPFAEEINFDKIKEFVEGTSKGFKGAIKKADFSPYLTWALTGECEDCEALGNIETPGVMVPTLYIVGASLSMVILSVAIIMAIAMFIVRNLAIWLLVILSPLAFAAYILPSTKKAFSAWWHQVLQWSFIGVSMSFFMYLSTVMMYTAKNIQISSAHTESAAAAMLADITTLVVKAVFPAIVAVVGLFLSAQGGNKFAGIALDKAKAVGKWTAGLGVAGIGAAAGYAGAKIASGTKGFFGKEGTRRYELARKLEQSRYVPIKPGTLTRPRREEVERKTEEYKKQFKLASTNELKDRADRLKRLKIFGKDRIGEARALIEQLIERDELDASYAPIIKQLESQGYKGEANKAKKKLPLLAIDASKSIQENQRTLEELFRQMANDERQKIQPDAYTSPIVTRAALNTVTNAKEFSATISNYKAARAIGQSLSGASINDIERDNPIAAQQLAKPTNQRKMGIRLRGNQITTV
jgi:hypothetical protein